jgi:hypothetical protein
MEPPDFIGRSSDRTLELVANPTLQDLVGRQPDRIFDPLRFEKLVDLGHGEGCSGSGGSGDFDALTDAAHEKRHYGRPEWANADREIALELTGHGLALSKCEAYNRVYDQF